jgi:hypothetical protein
MHEILLKGEGWLGGEMGKALRRTNGRRNTAPPKPPASRRERILDILLFPIHVAIILTRAVANRFGWKLPGDARKEREAERERRRLHRARRRRRKAKREARGGVKPRKSEKANRKKPDAVKEGDREKGRTGGERRRRRNKLPVAASVPSGVKP